MSGAGGGAGQQQAEGASGAMFSIERAEFDRMQVGILPAVHPLRFV